MAFRHQLFKKHDVRNSICEIIADSLEMTDTRLLAFCIMTNHMHLIVCQGLAPLSRLMRPVMTRTALCVKRKYRIDGRVFGSVYHAFPIAAATHLRRAIVYTHLNPGRTKTLEDIANYPWSSHSLYVGSVNLVKLRLHNAITPDLRLFGDDSEESLHGCYSRHVEYWRHRDACKKAGTRIELSEPVSSAGDRWYGSTYVPAIQDCVTRAREDLRDIAERVLQQRDPPMDLKQLRTRGRNREIAAARKDVAISGYTAGYSVAAISSFLGISSGRVSQLTSRLKTYPPPTVRRVLRMRQKTGAE